MNMKGAPAPRSKWRKFRKAETSAIFHYPLS